MKTARRAWIIPAGAWAGEPCFILGGGASLRKFRAERLRGKGRVIAINDAGLVMAPWADVLFWADQRWLDWNESELHRHYGDYKITRSVPGRQVQNRHNIKWLRHSRYLMLSRDPRRLSGHCGGSAAINLAFLFGADPIVLLGFDMKPGHWHDRHRMLGKNDYQEKFIPALEAMAGELDKEGANVLNATPHSALTCFPRTGLGDVLT